MVAAKAPAPLVKKALLIAWAMSSPVSQGVKWLQFDVVTAPVTGSV